MEKIFTGKTIEDALAAASAELGLEKEDFTYEIVEYPNKGFLGIGAKPAEIKVNCPGDDKAEAAPAAAPKKAEKIKEPKEKPAVKEKAAAKPKTEQKQNKVVEGAESDVEGFINGLLDLMKIKAEKMEVSIEEGKYIKINMEGEELSCLTHRQGETVEAIQLMTALHMNRKNEQYYKATLDINNYREHSIEKLEHLAMKTAGQVLKTKRRITLRPMSSFQRRVIHAKLQEVENISTYSVGEEPVRRVVVQYQWPEKKSTSMPEKQ